MCGQGLSWVAYGSSGKAETDTAENYRRHAAMTGRPRRWLWLHRASFLTQRRHLNCAWGERLECLHQPRNTWWRANLPWGSRNCASREWLPPVLGWPQHTLEDGDRPDRPKLSKWVTLEIRMAERKGQFSGLFSSQLGILVLFPNKWSENWFYHFINICLKCGF